MFIKARAAYFALDVILFWGKSSHFKISHLNKAPKTTLCSVEIPLSPAVCQAFNYFQKWELILCFGFQHYKTFRCTVTMKYISVVLCKTNVKYEYSLALYTLCHKHISPLYSADFYIFLCMFLYVLICLAWIDGGRAVFHAYQSLITQVLAMASLSFLRDFPKVSPHINTFMHLVNRAAITEALAVMHCLACKSYRMLRRVAKVAAPSLLSNSRAFLCISLSLSFVLVCTVVRDTRCPEWGFTSPFSFCAETRLQSP